MNDGLTIKDIIMEVRDELGELRDSFADFKGRVVMKDELELWQETQRTTRRWAITTVLSVIGVLILAIGIIINI